MSEHPSPALSSHPSPWSVLNEGTKVLITLSTALLGLTVTFAQDFVSNSGRVWIAASWVTLLVSIALGVYTIGRIQACVKTSERAERYGDPKAIGFFNAAFLLLVISAALMAKGAWAGWEESPDNIGLAIARAEAAAESMTGIGSPTLLSVERSSEGGYLVVVDASKQTLEVILDANLRVSSVTSSP